MGPGGSRGLQILFRQNRNSLTQNASHSFATGGLDGRSILQSLAHGETQAGACADVNLEGIKVPSSTAPSLAWQQSQVAESTKPNPLTAKSPNR